MSDWEQDFEFYVHQSEDNREQHMAGVEARLLTTKTKKQQQDKVRGNATP